MATGPYLSIITLDVNGLNAPTKRLAEWIQKQDPYICCLQETHPHSNVIAAVFTPIGIVIGLFTYPVTSLRILKGTIGNNILRFSFML